MFWGISTASAEQQTKKQWVSFFQVCTFFCPPAYPASCLGRCGWPPGLLVPDHFDA